MPFDPSSFDAACRRATDWPLPGSGHTNQRLALLSAACREDLVLGRLVEAHADAVAIVRELAGGTVDPGQRWGVWAAGPAASVGAARTAAGWRLSGIKHWCSGATLLTHALIDAAAVDGQRLFAVALYQPGVRPCPPSWAGPGMAAADTRSVQFDGAEAEAVGEPGGYLDRPGFWAGAVGVAACWFGGTRRVADRLLLSPRRDDPHFAAHLGAVHADLTAGRAVLADAGRAIDGDPSGDHQVTALGVRAVVERVATAVMDRVGRALGPGPLAHDADHAAAVADLTVYIRQSHAEADMAELGRRLLGADHHVRGRRWPAGADHEVPW